LNNEEKYTHSIELLTSIDILLHAKIVICDFDSNVSRFIRLAHHMSNNVYDIRDRFKDLDFNLKIHPAFSFKQNE
jgi:hypothetical protein